MHKSKIILAVFSGTLLFFLWFFSPDNDEEQASPVTLDSRISKASPEQLELSVKLQQAEQPQVQVIDPQEKEILEEKLLLKKEDIDRNIQLLNDNLSNPEEREAIQEALAELIEEYNQAALPLLLSQL